MIARILGGLLACFRHPITNAATEGLHGKIQTMKSAARGFRSSRITRLRILFVCRRLDLRTGSRPLLINRRPPSGRSRASAAFYSPGVSASSSYIFSSTNFLFRKNAVITPPSSTTGESPQVSEV